MIIHNPHDTVRPIVPTADMDALAQIRVLSEQVDDLIARVSFVDHSPDLQDALQAVAELRDSARYATEKSYRDYCSMLDQEKAGT